MRYEIDIINSISSSRISFTLNCGLWDSFNNELLLNIQQSEWHEVKFLDESNTLHSSMNNIPNDMGGIYVFVVKPNIIPAAHMYTMYIGRALKTNSQNLRKRCKEYLNEERPKIARLINTWGKYLYIRYLPLSDNELINRLESELINSILPPCNAEIPNKELRDAVQAFSM